MLERLNQLASSPMAFLKENEGAAGLALLAFLIVASTFLRIGLAKGKAGHERRGFGISKNPLHTHVISILIVVAIGYAIFMRVDAEIGDCASYKAELIRQAHGAVSFMDYAVSYLTCFREQE